MAVTEIGGDQAARLQVIVTTFTDDDKILQARDDLEQAASQLSTDFGSAAQTVAVSGESFTGQESLAAFARAMIISLPIALLLTMLIVGFALRSVRFSLVGLLPIIIVVVTVWGKMALRGSRSTLSPPRSQQSPSEWASTSAPTSRCATATS
jgi:predicted RND superfamily exporter protein